MTDGVGAVGVFFNGAATTAVYPLSLHAALPVSPDIGTAGAYPGLANDRLAHDPDVATSAEGAPPAPSYPPTTPGSGARPGGGPDVVHP